MSDTDIAHLHAWRRLFTVDYCHFRFDTLTCDDCKATKRVRYERDLNPDEDYFDALFARPDVCARCAELLERGR